MILRSTLAAVCVLAASAAHARDDLVEPQARFLAHLSALCGSAFEGRLAAGNETDAAIGAERLVMHVRSCQDGELRIPFHVGADRSRTWVITRTPEGLRLKHDHRHEDGSEDILTQYGGDTREPGLPTLQAFPADRFSQDLFIANGIPQSASNVWSIEIEPERLFAYELRRENRHFRVEFDLSAPVEAPPPPWGADPEPSPETP